MKTLSTVVKARIDSELKEETEAIFSSLGMNSAEAIRLFYTQVSLRKGLPFEVRLPNEKTAKAIRELEAGKGKRFDSVDALFADLND